MSSFLQPDINKFPSAHNRGHGFRKFKTLQGCPNLAHHKISQSTKDIPSPRKTRSDSESRLQDISTMVKQDQQDHPLCRQILIGAVHISSSGHTGLSKLPVAQPRVAPGGHRRLTGWTNTHDEHWPGGVKIKMTLGLQKPKGKRG